jgi:chromosome segregation ATPase
MHGGSEYRQAVAGVASGRAESLQRQLTERTEERTAEHRDDVDMVVAREAALRAGLESDLAAARQALVEVGDAPEQLAELRARMADSEQRAASAAAAAADERERLMEEVRVRSVETEFPRSIPGLS